MKKLMTAFTVLLIAMVISMPVVKAQKAAFTGTVIYDVTVEGDIPEQAKAMMPTEMTTKFSVDQQSMVMNFGMMEQKTIYDVAKQEANMMMNVMGQKLLIKSNAAQIEEMRKKEGESLGAKVTNETATIAGFLCKKAVISKKGKDGATFNIDVYFTEDLDVSRFKFSNSFPEIDGLPLEFTMKNGPMSFKLKARSVKKENIPASEFAIATDYKQVTMEELQAMFSGGGGGGE
jgi:GLPGLI family protein